MLKKKLKLSSKEKPSLSKTTKKLIKTKLKVKSVKTNAVQHSIGVNCVFCTKFRSCDNAKKSAKYVCSKFSKFDPSKLQIKPAKTTIIVKDAERSEQLDFERMMADFNSQSNMAPLPPDMKIDDRDIPQAKNFLEFTTGKNFLNIKPFAKQLEIGLHAFSEICPNKTCTDWDYACDIPKDHTVDQILERITPLSYGCCENCGYRKSEMYADGFKIPTKATCLLGQRSGKSKNAAMVHTYIFHGNLKLQNASQVHGLLKNQILETTLVALTAENAKKLLYIDVEDYLRNSPWFKEYNSMLDYHGKKYGEELYRIREMFATYRCRMLQIKASDPDMRKLRGPTRLSHSVDELGWFISGKSNVKFDAKEILKSLNNSLKTVKQSYYKLLKEGMDGILPPMAFNLSSPSSKKDLIVKEYESAKTDSQAISFSYATWEANPNFKRRDFAQEFKDDPIAAMRDYGAVPPNSSAPFISDIDHVRRIVEKTRYNTVSCKSKDMTMPGGKTMRTGDLRIVAPKDGNKRILSIDCASVNNSFAIVMGYYDDVLQRCIFDTFVEIQNTHESELNFNAVFSDVIIPLGEHFNVGIVVADRFQSNKFIHDVQQHFQIPGEIYSVKYKDFSDFKQEILNSNITIPKPEMKPSEIEETGGDNYPYNFRKAPVAHFLYQIITVQDMKKEVLKGEGLTDDLFRAAVLAYSYMIDPAYQQYCSGKSQTAVIKPQFVAGVLASRGLARNMANGGSRAGTASNSEIHVAISSRGR